jgi:REP element-mobilizing transposase RayT
MSRRKRPHLPESAFHLTTRLHRSEALFEPALRNAVVGFVREQLVFTDLELLAYAIMPNHLHFVVRQGRQPLAAFMQPVLRRIALLVQRSFERKGHVFERRYRHTACADPEHLRNAIVYTHMNPVRAGLCATVDDYAWTSHAAWCGNGRACDGARDPAAPDLVLPLFAAGAGQCAADLMSDYRSFLEWRIRLDTFLKEAATTGSTTNPRPERPAIDAGDLNWVHAMTPRPRRHTTPSDDIAPRLDGTTGRAELADIVREVIAESGGGLDLAVVRSRWGGPPYWRARDAAILRAAALGYAGVQIAAYLRISPSAVSRALSRNRRRLLTLAR